jgi:hypothetical protein
MEHDAHMSACTYVPCVRICSLCTLFLAHHVLNMFSQTKAYMACKWLHANRETFERICDKHETFQSIYMIYTHIHERLECIHFAHQQTSRDIRTVALVQQHAQSQTHTRAASIAARPNRRLTLTQQMQEMVSKGTYIHTEREIRRYAHTHKHSAGLVPVRRP